VCGWSYEGSVENQHYFKHSACGFSVKTGKCVHGVSGPQSVIIVACFSILIGSGGDASLLFKNKILHSSTLCCFFGL